MAHRFKCYVVLMPIYAKLFLFNENCPLNGHILNFNQNESTFVRIYSIRKKISSFQVKSLSDSLPRFAR
jgi:hypothetical protein